MPKGYTVKPDLKATCIKQSPVFKGQLFRSLKGHTSVNLPVLSKHLPLFAFPFGACLTQVFLYSFCRFHPSVCLSILRLSVHLWFRPLTLSITKFYFKVFWLLINSVATVQNLFIFGIGIPGRVLFHSTSMNSWVCPRAGLDVRI